MTSSNAGSPRTCPFCNARNTNLSLFCAECGASLNGGGDGDTAAYAPVINRGDAQETSEFEPAPRTYAPADTARPNASAPAAAPSPKSGTPSYWENPRAPASDQAWSPIQEELTSPGYDQGPRGVRGFVLGTIAFLLVLAVFLLWTWASLLDQDTRDAIQDFFGFIG